MVILGIPFSVKDFCEQHHQWAHLGPYLRNRPQQPWTLFTITDSYKNHGKLVKSIKNKIHKKIYKKNKTKKQIK